MSEFLEFLDGLAKIGLTGFRTMWPAIFIVFSLIGLGFIIWGAYNLFKGCHVRSEDTDDDTVLFNPIKWNLGLRLFISGLVVFFALAVLHPKLPVNLTRSAKIAAKSL